MIHVVALLLARGRVLLIFPRVKIYTFNHGFRSSWPTAVTSRTVPPFRWIISRKDHISSRIRCISIGLPCIRVTSSKLPRFSSRILLWRIASILPRRVLKQYLPSSLFVVAATVIQLSREGTWIHNTRLKQISIARCKDSIII